MTENKTPLLIPSGVQISQSEFGINLEYSGNIVLHGDLGAQFHTIQSHNGNIILHYDAKAHTVYAPNGNITTNASLQAKEISAHEVHIGGDLRSSKVTCSDGHLQINGNLHCSDAQISGNCNILGDTFFESIVAEGDVNLVGEAKGDSLKTTGRIHLMGGGSLGNIEMAGTRLIADNKLTCGKITALDATVTLGEGSSIERIHAGHLFLSGQRNDVKVIQLSGQLNIGPGEIHSVITTANAINLDPETRGKIMVVETKHEPGPHLVKGCLQISDMEQLLPNSDAFFKQYKVTDDLEVSPQIPPVDTNPIDNPFTEQNISEHLQNASKPTQLESFDYEKVVQIRDTKPNTDEELSGSKSEQPTDSVPEPINDVIEPESIDGVEPKHQDDDERGPDLNKNNPGLGLPLSEHIEDEIDANGPSLVSEPVAAKAKVGSGSLELDDAHVENLDGNSTAMHTRPETLSPLTESLVEESDSDDAAPEFVDEESQIQGFFDESTTTSNKNYDPSSPEREKVNMDISIAAIQEENIDSVLEISDEMPDGLSIELDSEEDMVDDIAVPNILDEEVDGNSSSASLEENTIREEHELLHEQLDIIEKYYVNSTPDAVQQLHNAIHFGDPHNLMGDITTIFALLNKHHQRINSRMHPQVVHSFNIIHQHVQTLSL